MKKIKEVRLHMMAAKGCGIGGIRIESPERDHPGCKKKYACFIAIPHDNVFLTRHQTKRAIKSMQQSLKCR